MAVATEMLYDLGGFLRQRLKKGIWEQGKATQMLLDSSPVSVADLRQQWADQREAQLSIRAHQSFWLIFCSLVKPTTQITDAPARLKKELDMVLGLQAKLDSCDRALQNACATITKDQHANLTLDALDSMEHTHN